VAETEQRIWLKNAQLVPYSTPPHSSCYDFGTESPSPAFFLGFRKGVGSAKSLFDTVHTVLPYFGGYATVNLRFALNPGGHGLVSARLTFGPSRPLFI